MIPYFTLERIPILNSDTFSFFFFFAFVAGYFWGARQGKKKGFKRSEINEFFCFTFIPACFGAHVFHVLAYAPETLLTDPLYLLRLNKGLSSMGGIGSYFIFVYIFLRFKGQLHRWKEWLDMAAQGLIVGLLVGRIGCALVHDHLGTKTDFFLGMEYLGVVRHDLGIYEFLFLLLGLFPLSLYLSKKVTQPGAQVALFALVYPPVRFFFDSFRLEDYIVGGFTPAQYVCCLLFAFGLVVLRTMLVEKQNLQQNQ